MPRLARDVASSADNVLHPLASLRASRWGVPGALAGGLLAAQLVLVGVDPGPYYFTDSASYLFAVHRSRPRRTRPVGVSVLWRTVLLLHRSELTIVAAQVLLVTAAGMVAYAIACLLGVSRRLSCACAAAVSLSPVALLFERFLLSDAFAAFLLAAGTCLLVTALLRRRPWLCAASGTVLALAVAVRTDLVLTVLVGLVCVAALWQVRTLRDASTAAALFAAGALPILVGQMVWTQNATGSLSLSPWSGVVAIARTAHLVDCHDPTAAPPIRRQVCADGIPTRSYNNVIWRRGVVNRTLREPANAFERDNGQLLQLALTSMRQHPLKYLETIPQTIAADFGIHDPDAYEYAARPNGPARAALVRAGIPVAPTGGHRLFEPLLTAARAWAAIRWLMVAAAVAAVATTRRQPARRARIAVAAIAAAALGPALLLGGPVPRYVFGIEAISWPLAFSLCCGSRRTATTSEVAAPAPALRTG